MKDNPISPKVIAVVGALASPGVVLLLVGALIDNQTLITVGAALLGASPVAGAAGFAKNDPNRVVKKKRRTAREEGYAGIHPVVVVLLALIVFLVLWSVTGSLLIALLALLLLLLLL